MSFRMTPRSRLSMDRLVPAIRRNPLLSWVLAIAYAVLVTFPHEQVQTLVNNLASRMGRSHFYVMMGSLALAGGAGLSIALVHRLRVHSDRRTVIAFWFITLALIAATWKVLTFNNSELVHYPQYLPLGVFLVLLTGSPVEAMAWSTICGSLDESFQYWGLHGGWGVPFDFNDIYMDMLGAALGALLAVAFVNSRTGATESAGRFLKRLALRPGVFTILSIVVIGIGLWSCGLMQLYQSPASHWFALSRMAPLGFWFQDVTWGPHKTHILTPLEGPALILITLVLYAFLERRLSRPS